MLVLQPRIFTATDCAAVGVNVGVGVSVGRFVGVDEGTSVLVTVTGTMTVIPGLVVTVKGMVSMIGVAVRIFGVRVGIDVQTGNGCSESPHVSHAARIKTRTSKADNFFMIALYSCILPNGLFVHLDN